jgi:hypothetical protein
VFRRILAVLAALLLAGFAVLLTAGNASALDSSDPDPGSSCGDFDAGCVPGDEGGAGSTDTGGTGAAGDSTGDPGSSTGTPGDDSQQPPSDTEQPPGDETDDPEQDNPCADGRPSVNDESGYGLDDPRTDGNCVASDNERDYKDLEKEGWTCKTGKDLGAKYGETEMWCWKGNVKVACHPGGFLWLSYKCG